MKKALTVLAAVLLLAALFVGCGIGSQLEGTSWENTNSGYGMTTTITFTFEKDGVLTLKTHAEFDDGDMPESNATVKGTWAADGDELTITVGGKSSTGKATIDGDVLTMTYMDVSMDFTKVK